jgi:ABC-type phosphate/phosphonate transport system ATPase subunit
MPPAMAADVARKRRRLNELLASVKRQRRRSVMTRNSQRKNAAMDQRRLVRQSSKQQVERCDSNCFRNRLHEQTDATPNAIMSFLTLWPPKEASQQEMEALQHLRLSRNLLARSTMLSGIYPQRREASR